MGMSGVVRGLFAVMTAIVILYILEITYGAAMDSLYMNFAQILPTLPMTTGWKNIATGTLGGWVWFYRSFTVIIIAVFVWLVSLIFVETDYSTRVG
jgi:hypothetical protein